MLYGNALGSIQRYYSIFDPIHGVSVVGPGIEQVLTDKGSGSCEGWYCRHFWSLLVLWEYGGSIYCDLDTLPRKWKPDFIQPSDDAHFVVEQFGTPSQYWMAASSKHPMMFHSLQRALYNTLGLLEIGGMDASLVAGPQAVMQGFMWFNKDVGVHVVKPVVEVVYVGRFNRSVRLEGIAEKSNKVILRQRIGKNEKKKMYHEHDPLFSTPTEMAGFQSNLHGSWCTV